MYSFRRFIERMWLYLFAISPANGLLEVTPMLLLGDNECKHSTQGQGRPHTSLRQIDGAIQALSSGGTQMHH